MNPILAMKPVKNGLKNYLILVVSSTTITSTTTVIKIYFNCL